MNKKFSSLIKFFSTIFFKVKNPFFEVKTGPNTLILFTRITSFKNYKNNSISIGRNVSLRNCQFFFYGMNNKIKIHDGAKLENVTFWIEDEHNEIIIGKNTTFHGNCQLAACEGTSILIGEDCMFSHDIYVRTTDSHSIIKNNKRINTAKNVKIGNHVWLGMQCLILKGADIPSGCVIGARSIVSSSAMDKNCIYAGQPTKLINKDIIWNRKRF